MATYNPVPVRRGSLVGPLIVVLLGVIFLLSNFRPELSLWKIFARYWPFLLIFWGAGRLLEYFVARATSRPIARTLTGGEVFLVILICLIGSGLFAAARGDWGLPRWSHRSIEVFGANYDFPLEAGREIPANATVVVNNLNGNVTLTGADTQQLKITGRKSVKAYSQTEADKADKATPLEISVEEGRVYVRTNQDRDSGRRRISTDLEITVPRTVSVTLEGRYGDFQVNNVAGPVEVNSNNAGVRLSEIAKDVRVSLRRSDIVRATQVKGNVDISGRGRDIELEQVAGTVTINGDFSCSIKIQDVAKPVRYTSSQTELSLEKLPGKMEMDLGSLTATNVVGPVKLTARSKDVRIEDFTKEIDITSRRGDIELRASKLPLANIHAESHSGDIQLQVPAGARFSLEATTASGGVKNEYSESIKVVKQGKSAEMRGEVAGSGAAAQVRLVTDRGAITIKKS
ncbi:MAG: DUF4097 family beta strand repeat protein [Acidobacteria bacterium]|nr:DUF4097 family beta strand repeat protein [Acidobacteriota bacterium]